MKLVLGTAVRLSPGDFVLDGDLARLPQRGGAPYPIFGLFLLWPNGIKMLLGMDVGLSPGDFVLDGDPVPPPKKGFEIPQFLAHVYCGQTAGWIKMPLGMKVGLSPGDFVRW